MVGEQWSRRAHELRDMLRRNGVPYGFYRVDEKEGRRLLEERSVPAARLPVAIIMGGPVLQDPSDGELIEALGGHSHPHAQACDLVVIGAGPAGLAAAVYGASEGLETTVVEAEALGGQAGQSSMIRNYLGFPAGISGEELAARAYHQAWQFGARFVLANGARDIKHVDDEYEVVLADGERLHACTVIVATGTSYRSLPSSGLQRLVGRGVFYGSVTSEARALLGGEVFVVGGGNAAGQAALHLSKYARRVTVVVRREGLEESMSAYLIRILEETPNVEVSTCCEGGGRGRAGAAAGRDDPRPHQRRPAEGARGRAVRAHRLEAPHRLAARHRDA